MKSLIWTLFLVVGMCSTVVGQIDSAAAQAEARIWAEVRKPYFQATANDSLFIVNNSEYPFRYDSYTRSEIAGFMEQLFFTANPGNVVGPLYLDGFAILYKVVAFDSTYQMNASHIYIKPEGKTAKDTTTALKKADKLLKQINKGLDFATAAKQHGQDEVAKEGGNLGWFGEGLMVKEFEEAVMRGKKGDLFVLQTPFGAHVVRINEDKIKQPRGRVIVIPLIKKIW